MQVTVLWSASASGQFNALSAAEQASVLNVQDALRLSPRSGHYYRLAQTKRGSRATWVIYGLLVRVIYTLEVERRGLLVLAVVCSS